jgi:ElaB/YqjD/DUF883 family membrane-anchored ribosome-binding protein
MKMADRDLNKELDGLKKDFSELRSDLRKLAETGGAVTGDAVSAARVKLEQETEKLMGRLQDAASGVKDQSGRMLHGMEDRIEDRPLASVLTTFGVGFAIGWLLGRR